MTMADVPIKTYIDICSPSFSATPFMLYTIVFVKTGRITISQPFIESFEDLPLIENYLNKLAAYQGKVLLDYLIDDLQLSQKFGDFYFFFNEHYLSQGQRDKLTVIADSPIVYSEDIKKDSRHHSQQNQLRELENYISLLLEGHKNIAAIHIIPYFRTKTIGSVSLVFNAEQIGLNDSLSKIFHYMSNVKTYLGEILDQVWTEELIAESLRSGIAAIMSRNASHNIGSHVLARIATGNLDDLIVDGKKNLLPVWFKDVQILSRYIQQRMDFIAQISTEWPGYTEPAYLLKDLLRWFLHQKHLLNFIAASENLCALLFDQEGNPLPKPDDMEGDIRLHVFMVPESLWRQPCVKSLSDFDECLQARRKEIADHCFQEEGELDCRRKSEEQETPCEDCHRILLEINSQGARCQDEQDILLAIPGGLVGYHAFYVILENVIRNAAKHGFARQEQETRQLDIVIEILYDPEEKIGIQRDNKKLPAFLFRIYDNVSQVANPDKQQKGVHLWMHDPSNKGINNRLGTSIIDETGQLRKEDWGLAEMKIAAGYLQRRDVLHIGGEKEKIGGYPQEYSSIETLDETMEKNGTSNGGAEAIIRAVSSPIGTLGYEFFIPKPRMVGVVCSDKGNE